MDPIRASDLVDQASLELGYDLAQLVALTSIWVHPETFEILRPAGGTWFPERRRANLGLRVKGEQMERVGQVIEGVTLDNNTYANVCFKRALGLHRHQLVGFHICHIWEGTSYDPACYTNVANLVAIPAELSSLTDFHPRISASLKYRSWELYRWKPEKQLAPAKPEGYPGRWREPFPINDEARRAARRRVGHKESRPEVAASPRAAAQRYDRVTDETRRSALITAWYLSRFGHEHLGLGNQDQTFTRAAERIGIKKTTLKNRRDRFDPHTESGRRGWWQAGPLEGELAAIHQELSGLPEEEVRARVMKRLGRKGR